MRSSIDAAGPYSPPAGSGPAAPARRGSSRRARCSRPSRRSAIRCGSRSARRATPLRGPRRGSPLRSAPTSSVSSPLGRAPQRLASARASSATTLPGSSSMRTPRAPAAPEDGAHARPHGLRPERVRAAGSERDARSRRRPARSAARRRRCRGRRRPRGRRTADRRAPTSAPRRRRAPASPSRARRRAPGSPARPRCPASPLSAATKRSTRRPAGVLRGRQQVLALGDEAPGVLAPAAPRQAADLLELLVVGARDRSSSCPETKKGALLVERRPVKRSVGSAARRQRPTPHGRRRQIGGTSRGRARRCRPAPCGRARCRPASGRA